MIHNSIRRIAAISLLVLCICVCVCTGTLAEPGTPTPNGTSAPGGTAEPSSTPQASSGELIKFKATGEEIVRIQLRLRELGYFNYKPTGSYQNMSVQAAIAFQQKQGIMADGSIGAQTKEILFSVEAVRCDITADIPFGKALEDTAALVGELVSWNDVKGMLVVGNGYSVTDYNTGAQWSMVYMGGDNHAEMKCVVETDDETYKATFGGEYNYSKRPVVINIGGRNIAASLQGMPHGDDNHSCMYFQDSLSHVGAMPDVEHIDQVYKAAGRS